MSHSTAIPSFETFDKLKELIAMDKNKITVRSRGKVNVVKKSIDGSPKLILKASK